MYEDKLNQCGFKGGLPYWEWGYDVKNPRDSPVFDGSDTSLGSDGDFVPNKPNVELQLPLAPAPIVLKPGTGGGCVTGGPFGGMKTRLGPMTEADPTQNNERCLKRDLNPDCAQRFTTFRNTTELIINSPDIKTFATTLVSIVPGLALSVYLTLTTSPPYRRVIPATSATRSVFTAVATLPLRVTRARMPSSPPATRPSTSTTRRSTASTGSGRCLTSRTARVSLARLLSTTSSPALTRLSTTTLFLLLLPTPSLRSRT